VKGGGAALEMASKIKTVVFDKTGTLTVGKPTVSDSLVVKLLDNMTESYFWQLISTVESSSDHPLAKAVVKFVTDKNLKSQKIKVTDVIETGGMGLSAKFGEFNEYTVVIGNEKWMLQNNLDTRIHQKTILQWTGMSKSKSSVMIGIMSNLDGAKHIVGLMSITDQVRPQSKMVVQRLQDMGIEVWMITGDHVNTARSVGNSIGIKPENVLAQVLPEEKYERIKEIQQNSPKGHKVAMVGDGINDSVAIAQADVGIAIGAGSDIAIEAAQIILVKSSLMDVITLIDLSHTVINRIVLNFIWALGYNALGIPIAAGCLYAYGIGLAPWVAGLAMAFSSVSVVCSSLLLNTYEPPETISLY
jgi:Cu+-exporting ATPase